MKDELKKQNIKDKDNNFANYLNNITLKCEYQKPIVKVLKKVSNDNILIPSISTYNNLIYNYYNLQQLKCFVKYYKLKTIGNKQEIIRRLYSYLYFASNIIKVQRIFRGYLVKKYKVLHGPCVKDRTKCTNSVDFITMDKIEEINFHQFISYKDSDGFIYGFDISSLHNLFLKSDNDIKNPYNRNLIPDFVFKNIRGIIRIGRILGININLSLDEDTSTISNEKSIELKAVTLFQQIDALGNYSNASWFLSLNKIQLIKYIRELVDIWKYRAQLNNEIKRNICPPIGDPFVNLSIPYIIAEENLWNIKKILLDVIDNLINTGITKDSKSLGAYYVLGALTLVNADAAESLPWLFQSVNYF